MPIKNKKETVRRWVIGIWQNCDFRLMEELASEDYIYETPGRGELSNELFRDFVTKVQSGFQDFNITIDFQIQEGGIVVTRGTNRGTHRASFFGIDPTGNSIEASWVLITRFRDDLILKECEIYDVFATLLQLGAIESPFLL